MGESSLSGDASPVTWLAIILIAIPILLALYAYVLYPAMLWVLANANGERTASSAPSEWPRVTITLPVYNEERTLGAALEHVLSLDYPADRRHVLVISDASTDRTDAIARAFAARGVELIRLPRRSGKTAAENAAAAHIRGDIVVNIDATARPAPDALKALVAAFRDPTVGVASGRDVSTGLEAARANAGETRYVGYEMWVRSLETRFGSIVGASGCFYAIRTAIYESAFPEALSRDFASALIAWEHGLRAVSVDQALCGVPRSGSLNAEFHRKVRTMHRGLATLWYKRAMLHPRKHGRFALMLFSHKLCRWLVPPASLAGGIGLALLATSSLGAALALGTLAAALGVSALAFRLPGFSDRFRVLALPSYALLGTIAGIMAWWEVLRRQREAIWEPTRRPA